MRIYRFFTLVGILWSFLDDFAAVLLFDSFTARRCQKRVFWPLVFAFAVLNRTVSTAAIPTVWGRAACSVAVFFLMHTVLYQGSAVLGFFVTLIFYSFYCCLSELLLSLMVSLPPLYFASKGGEYIGLLMEILSFLALGVLIVLVCFFVKRVRTRRSSPQTDWRWYCVPAAVSASSLAMLFGMEGWMQEENRPGTAVLAFYLYVLFVNILSLLLVSWMEQAARSREETLALQARVHAQSESIEALSASYTAQRTLTHDFRAHLDVLDTLLAEKQFDEAARYIRELHEMHTERILLVNTHNPTLDALLNQKAVIAQKNRIDIQFTANDLSALQISSTDLTVVIGNLLDNAIEASQRLEEGERRIVVKAILEEDFFFSVRNRCQPVRIIDGEIPSTKPDPTLHGYGLRSVKTILGKYHSCYAMDYADGWFVFSTELPNRLLA